MYTPKFYVNLSGSCINKIANDGSYIVIGSESGNLKIISRSGETITSKDLNEKIKDIALSPDNSYIVVATNKKVHCFYDLGGIRWDEKIRADTKIMISPDNSYVNFGSAGDVYSISEYGKKTKEYIGKYWDLKSITSENQLSVVVNKRNKLEFLERSEPKQKRFQSLKSIWGFEEENLIIHNVVMSSDGKKIIIFKENKKESNDNDVVLVNKEKYQKKIICFSDSGDILWEKECKSPTGIVEMAISQDSNYIVIRNWYNKIYFFTIDGNRLWKHELDKASIEKFYITPDGSYLAAWSMYNAYVFSKSGEIIWKSDNLRSSNEFIESVSISNDGSLLAISSRNLNGTSTNSTTSIYER